VCPNADHCDGFARERYPAFTIQYARETKGGAMPRNRTMPEVVSTYLNTDGLTVTVYADAPVKRERAPLRKAGMRTSGRKTRTEQRAGIGSWKGCK